MTFFFFRLLIRFFFFFLLAPIYEKVAQAFANEENVSYLLFCAIL